MPNLTVLGVGNRAPNSLECLTSPRMTDLVSGSCARNSTTIVLDSPPIIPFSGRGVGSLTLSDASIVVARCDSTTRGAVMFSSLKFWKTYRPQFLGVVLNGVDLKEEYYSYGMKDYGSYATK